MSEKVFNANMGGASAGSCACAYMCVCESERAVDYDLVIRPADCRLLKLAASC